MYWKLYCVLLCLTMFNGLYTLITYTSAHKQYIEERVAFYYFRLRVFWEILHSPVCLVMDIMVHGIIEDELVAVVLEYFWPYSTMVTLVTLHPLPKMRPV